MAGTPIVGSFPSPYEVETPPGCEGWEDMYPYYARFDEERREADEQRFWFWNSMHFPVPMPAFDAICIDTAYQALGTWQNRVFAVPPAMGIDWRCINGYIYISGNPVTDPAKIAERAEFFQKRAGLLLRELGRPLREVAHEDGRADRGARGAARCRSSTSTSRTRSPSRTRRRATAPSSTRTGRALRLADLMWQNHFEFLLLGYGAYMTFAELCKANLPDIPDQHIAQMVAGLDVLLFKPDAELRRLARLAIDTGVDGAFVEGRSPAEIDAALAESDAGARWLAELEQVKDPWFHMATGDGLYHTYGSWLDDPTIPYASLIGHVAALKAGEEIERPTDHIAAERERLATEYAALLDDDARKGFEELLALSRTVFPYVEEHKFICDYWFLTSWWNKIREFGDLLVAHGFLPDRDGIFQLSRLEVHSALDELLLTWATGGRPRGPTYWPPIVAHAARAARAARRLDAAAGGRRGARGDAGPGADHALGRDDAARPRVGAEPGGRLRADRHRRLARRRRGRRPRRQDRRARSATSATARSSSAASPRPPGRRSSRRSGRGHRHRRRHVPRGDRLPRVRAARRRRHRPRDLADQRRASASASTARPAR